MATITAKAILDQLRSELVSRRISHREIQRLLGGVAFRHKLKAGAETLISVDELVRVLEVAGIDKVGFFARLAGLGGLNLAIFGRPKKEHWTRRQRKILRQAGDAEERGAGGYAEVRAELRRIELLRDEDPKAAEAAAWKFLAGHRAPGALVGALAILAVEAPRPNAVRLFSLALELLGPDLQSAPGARVMMAMGRCLAAANLPVFDFALFLHNLGKGDQAGDLLKAELWNVLDLEDVELQQKFAGLSDALGISHQIARTALLSRPATIPCQPRPAPNQRQLSSSPGSRARGPKA